MIGTAWSLLPPIVAIALALKTKEVYSSLFIRYVACYIPYKPENGLRKSLRKNDI